MARLAEPHIQVLRGGIFSEISVGTETANCFNKSQDMPDPSSSVDPS